MKRDAQGLLGFLVLMIVCSTFIHEALHWIPAFFLGMSPSFAADLPYTLSVHYNFPAPTLLLRLVVRHLPELVFLSVAAIFVWRFRKRELLPAYVGIALLMASTAAIYGHTFHT